MLRSTSAFVIILFAALVTGCGSDSSGTTGPTPVSITESFTGTINTNGAATFPFPVQQTGSVTATLTAITPDGTTVGVSLGTWNGSVCQVILANDATTAGTTVTGTAAGTGNFCTRVYDAAGTLTGPTDFVITVVHF